MVPFKKISTLNHELTHLFEDLSSCSSLSDLEAHHFYISHKKQITQLMEGVEYGFIESHPPAKKTYRAVAWNIERGVHYDRIIEVLQTHDLMKSADLLFLTETDIGMARSRNANVALEMAQQLGYNYFFAPCYLNLCKGNSVEGHHEGDNLQALHGNAFLSRYPISNLRAVPLFNCKDKMRGKEKRIGCQKALVCDVEFPGQKMTAVVAHLDAHSSQVQRAGQMELILNTLSNEKNPVLVGGDLNTNTYNSSRAIYAFFGFWNKVFRGVDHAIRDHYPYPDRKYDKHLFEVFKKHGFDYENFNEIGVGTLHYSVEDMKANHLVREVVPKWCQKIMEETLRRHGGKVSLKIDWFAGRGLKSVHLDNPQALCPQVIPGYSNNGLRLSDHDPILVDFRFN